MWEKYFGQKMGKNFPGSPNAMDFTVFSHAMGDWCGSPCISHILKYSIGCESNGEKAPILWEKYQFPWLSPYHAICIVFPYCGKLMGKSMHFPYGDIDLWFEWSVKKPCVAKVLLAIWEIFLHENNRDYNSYKFAFVLFLFFLTNQRQKSGSQQIDGLVTKKYLFFVFCLTESRSHFKTMSNLIDFYKGIFLQVTPVCIIIPWFRQGR